MFLWAKPIIDLAAFFGSKLNLNIFILGFCPDYMNLITWNRYIVPRHIKTILAKGRAYTRYFFVCSRKLCYYWYSCNYSFNICFCIFFISSSSRLILSFYTESIYNLGKLKFYIDLD